MENLREIIAQNITELRQQMKMTQSNLADVLNYSDKAVSKWERAEAIPDITVLKQIADYFDVSVDYLLKKKHDPSETPSDRNAKLKRKNHFIISTLAVMLVWFVSVLVFTVFVLFDVPHPWCAFLVALPTASIVALVFNSIWGIRRLNFFIISVLSWTAIAAAHVIALAYFGKNIWSLYLIGVPSQLIIILSGFIRFKKR